MTFRYIYPLRSFLQLSSVLSIPPISRVPPRASYLQGVFCKECCVPLGPRRRRVFHRCTTTSLALDRPGEKSADLLCTSFTFWRKKCFPKAAEAFFDLPSRARFPLFPFHPLQPFVLYRPPSMSLREVLSLGLPCVGILIDPFFLRLPFPCTLTVVSLARACISFPQYT